MSLDTPASFTIIIHYHPSCCYPKYSNAVPGQARAVPAWEGLMGTILERKRRNRSVGCQGQILLKRDGKIIHRESKTFDRRQARRGMAGEAREGTGEARRP